jgi:hypothetical protein
MGKLMIRKLRDDWARAAAARSMERRSTISS